MIQLSLSGNYSSVSIDNTHFYVAGDTGIDIINKVTQRSEGFISFPSGVNDIWAEDDAFVFFGSNIGLYKFEKPNQFILGEDLTSRVVKDSRSKNLIDETILSIDGIDRIYMIVGTASGVNITNPGGVFHSSQFFPVTSVELVDNGEIFYGGAFGLATRNQTVNDISSSWPNADIHIIEPFIPSVVVNDIDSIVNKTGEVILGVATASGVVLIQKKDPLAISPTTKFFTGS